MLPCHAAVITHAELATLRGGRVSDDNHLNVLIVFVRVAGVGHYPGIKPATFQLPGKAPH